MSAAVELVLEELESAGFRRLPKPLIVAGAVFDFDAAVMGTNVNRSHDLVLVGGQVADPVDLVQLLSGLNRSLDRVASRRPVSLVLVGSRPEPATLAELEDNARVMVIEDELPAPAAIRNASRCCFRCRFPTTGEVVTRSYNSRPALAPLLLSGNSCSLTLPGSDLTRFGRRSAAT